MNPYKVLGLDHRADKGEILRAANAALAERRATAREVAAAQRELLDPVSRACCDFLQFLDPPGDEKPPLPGLLMDPPPGRLERLSLFGREVEQVKP